VNSAPARFVSPAGLPPFIGLPGDRRIPLHPAAARGRRLEHFPAKCAAVRRGKCDKCNNLERVSDSKGTETALVDGVRDARDRGVELRAKTLHDGNDRNGDAGGDDAVFDRGCGRFII